MKWDSIEPQPNKFSFTAGDKIASLAKANGQLLRCHNLVWHQQLPAWVTGGTWTKDTLTAALKNHITNEVTHYKGQCYAWDVVNEALEDNGTFRNDVFFRVLGQDYIKIAFETAAAADPDTKLYYNDFNIESPGKKSTAAQGIIKTLKAAGVKVDGAGFQAHFTVGGTPSKAVQMANLQAFTALGVEVAITELDIRMKLPSTDALIAQQKKDYATSTSACVAVKGCVGITVWDFDDKVGLMNRYEAAANCSSIPGFHRPSLVQEMAASSTTASRESKHTSVLWLASPRLLLLLLLLQLPAAIGQL